MRQVMAEVVAWPPFAAHARPRDIVWRVDEEEVRTLLETAGFEVTGIELYDRPYVRASADAAVRYSESNSFGNC